MLNFFLFFTFGKPTGKTNENYVLRTLYIRPKNNPLEVYSPNSLPLCFTENYQVQREEEMLLKGASDILPLTQDIFNKNKTICLSNISQKNATKLKEYFQKKYEICFDINGSRNVVPLSLDKDSLFSHFKFFVNLNQKGKIRIQNITPSVPINISTNTTTDIHVNFVFEFEKIPKLTLVSFSKKAIKFYVVVGAFLGIVFILLLNPSMTFRPVSAVVSTIPKHSYILVMLCGAGSGVLSFLVAFAIIQLVKPNAISSWWYTFAIPAATSSFMNSVVTTILCTTWKLKDVASAHYFAPLLVPALSLFIIFSVQWIPVCVGTCLNIPLKGIFYFIIAVIFVKLPVNLVISLMTGAIISFTSFNHLHSIPVRRIITSRKIFMVISNSIIFIIIFPFSQLFGKIFDCGLSNADWGSIILFVPLWFFACICIGMSSLALGDAEDWAMFAFLGSAGSGFIYWIVRYVIDIFLNGMTGTLQQSLQSAISAMVGLIISLSGGSISVLSAFSYILFKGSPAKTA